MKQQLLAAFGAIAALSAQVDAQSVHYEGGVSVASGTYIFTERTTSWTVLNGLALGSGPFTLRVTVPVLIQNSGLLAGTTTGLLPTGGSHSGAVRDSSYARGGQGKRQGASMQVTMPSPSFAASSEPVSVPISAVSGFEPTIGDPTLAVSLSSGGRTGLTVSAAVKIPATDTTHFGTGEWDLGGTVGVAHLLGNSTLLSADVSYWHLGNLPDLELADPIMASVGVAFLTVSGWGATLSMTGAQSVIEGFEDSYSASAGLTHLTGGSAFGVSASVGFTETAPDFSLGVSWRVPLKRG